MSDVIDVVRLAGEKIDLCIQRTDDAALELYLKWMNDEEINWFLGRNDTLTSIAEEREYVEKKPEQGKYKFSIVEKESRRLVGNCDIIVWRNHFTGSLGICIGEHDVWNKGYGTEAIKLLVNYGFKELNLHRMCLSVMEDNERARACYKKAGFEECGCEHEVDFHSGAWRNVINMEILNPAHKTT